MVQGVLPLCSPGSQVHSPKLSYFSVLRSPTFPLGFSLWTKVLFVFSKGLWKSLYSQTSKGTDSMTAHNSSWLRSQAKVWTQRLGGEMLVNVTRRICWCSQVKIPTSSPPTTLDLEKSSHDVCQTRDKAGTEIHYIYQADSPESQL